MSAHSQSSQSSLTLGALLFGHENEDAGALQLSPSWDEFEASLAGASAELVGMTSETVGREVATAIADAENIELGDLMIYGWRTHRHLVEAARRTLQEPGKKEVIRFASHRLTTTRHPVVDLTVSGVRLYSAHFTVTVTFDLDLAVGVIEQGRLMKMTTGGFTVVAVLEAELPAGDVEMIRRKRQVNSRLVIPLGRGIPLIDPEQVKQADVVAPRQPPDAAEPPGDATDLPPIVAQAPPAG